MMRGMRAMGITDDHTLSSSSSRRRRRKHDLQ
jgi:hypothetical protein